MEKRRGMSTFQDRFPSCLKEGECPASGSTEYDGVRRPVLVRSSVRRMMLDRVPSHFSLDGLDTWTRSGRAISAMGREGYKERRIA